MSVFTPGNILPSSGLQGHLHSLCIYTHTTIHTNKNKSLREKKHSSIIQDTSLPVRKMSMCAHTHSHEQEYTRMYKYAHNTRHPEQ